MNRTPRSTRAACALAALLCSTALIGSMLTGFDRQSPRDWLVPTPALMADVQRCDRHAGRTPREACVQAVVAAHREPTPLRMAARD